ncbi:unnamed protein product [Cuscuta epithymum]|uniref:Uncharacterized protein n=1 Tax=Cuscuta epithymum TaxID=186058 RepID=A0AAV0D2T1_9ASTE|nr:unnamed protein product [Cuscuta epithymum]
MGDGLRVAVIGLWWETGGGFWPAIVEDVGDSRRSGGDERHKTAIWEDVRDG